MYKGFLHLHLSLAILLTIGLLLAIIYFSVQKSRKKEFTQFSFNLALWIMIFAHLQLLAGVILFFLSPYGMQSLSSEVMGNPSTRFYAVEHPLLNILAIAVITFGFAGLKKITVNRSRFYRLIIYYSIALVLLLSRFPWERIF